MGEFLKMKLFSLFTLFAASSAGMIEIWDENGMVAYVDESERGSAVFGVPDKGPRECAGKKIPTVKHGKFHCKPLPKNKPRGKKKKCVFKCDPGFSVQWTKKGKASKKAKDGKIKCKAGEGWIAKPKSLKCVKN